MRAGLACLLLFGCGAADPSERPATLSYLLPALFAPHCATSGCHSRFTRAANLVLEGSPDTVRQTLVFKGFVFPGQPEGSPLLNFLRGKNVVLRMPPDSPLPEEDIALVERWIRLGALP